MSYIEMETPKETEKKVSAHPKVSVMVDAAIMSLAERKGSSLQAIYKYISANYDVDVKKLSHFVKKHLKAAVERGDLIQPKGKGASGSFKINKQKAQPKPKSPKLKPPKSLITQTSTPAKKKKAKTKSPNKSPVRKLKATDQKAEFVNATYSKPKAKTAKKPKLSLPTKPRKSLSALPAKVKKPKKLKSKNTNEPKVPVSEEAKSANSITSPKPVKTKGAAKATKVKKSPKSGKPLIPKKAVGKKASSQDDKK